jgi:2-C-methyl-D-erythritol 2,4-cyclodiphosphate synthase
VDSRTLLAEVAARVRAAGFDIQNVDASILAESPKLAPHKAAMCRALADVLNVPQSAIGIKAGTNEGLDAVGRGEAIACWAVALVVQVNPPS